MNYIRRFVFVHYEDLLDIRFKKLEKVTDKLFVFLPEGVNNVPIWLVRQMQNMGPDLEWIDLGSSSEDGTPRVMSFHIGVIHEKVDLGVEFAILSDDEVMDELVAHIQNTGRSCVRVKQKATAATDDVEEGYSEDFETFESHEPSHAKSHENLDRNHSPSSERRAFSSATTTVSRGNVGMRQPLQHQPSVTEAEDVNITSLSDDLVRRLIRSGNRPNDLSMLRSYILLHSEESNAVNYVDEIITHMEGKGEIKLKDGTISYNF